MAGITKPKALHRGDTIAIVAPASKPRTAHLKIGVRRLKAAGYDVFVHPQCRQSRGYLAGDDRTRADALMEVFAEDKYKAVFCARGGFGCARLLPYLDFKLIKSKPKIFIGYSDITILLQAFNINGFVTFHGAMPSVELSRRVYRYSFDSLLNVITSTRPIGRLHNPKHIGVFKKYRPGKATGIITGGNLSLMQKLIGTEYMPSFKNKIVFLEDTEEDPYRIDGYLSHLFTATDISQAAGFIFGDWIDCKITNRTKPSLTLDQVLKDYFGGLNVPIITNVACGHGRQNLTIPLGVKAFMDADKKIIEITEKAVS